MLIIILSAVILLAALAVRFRTVIEKFVKGNLHSTNSPTAEMCKLVENSSRDVQIAFANELSMICDEAGVDIHELISLVVSDDLFVFSDAKADQ